MHQAIIIKDRFQVCRYCYVYGIGLHHQQKGGNLIPFSRYKNRVHKLRKGEVPVLSPGKHHMN